MMQTINAGLLPRITSWQQAKDFWEEAKPLRANPDYRFLGRSRDQSKWVIRRPGDVFAFRYHRTDVVTYHPDGRLVIKPYSSTSTVLFASRLTPSYLTISGSSGTRRTRASFRVNNCTTRTEFVVDTHTQQLRTQDLVREYVVKRVSQKGGLYTALARRFIMLRDAHLAVIGEPKHVLVSPGPPVELWRETAEEVDSEWPSAFLRFEHYSDDTILAAGLILDRALVREPLPFGEPPKRTKYSHLWQIVEDR